MNAAGFLLLLLNLRTPDFRAAHIAQNLLTSNYYNPVEK